MTRPDRQFVDISEVRFTVWWSLSEKALACVVRDEKAAAADAFRQLLNTATTEELFYAAQAWIDAFTDVAGLPDGRPGMVLPRITNLDTENLTTLDIEDTDAVSRWAVRMVSTRINGDATMFEALWDSLAVAALPALTAAQHLWTLLGVCGTSIRAGKAGVDLLIEGDTCICGQCPSGEVAGGG